MTTVIWISVTMSVLACILALVTSRLCLVQGEMMKIMDRHIDELTERVAALEHDNEV